MMKLKRNKLTTKIRQRCNCLTRTKDAHSHTLPAPPPTVTPPQTPEKIRRTPKHSQKILNKKKPAKRMHVFAILQRCSAAAQSHDLPSTPITLAPFRCCNKKNENLQKARTYGQERDSHPTKCAAMHALFCYCANKEERTGAHGCRSLLCVCALFLLTPNLVISQRNERRACV